MVMDLCLAILKPVWTRRLLLSAIAMSCPFLWLTSSTTATPTAKVGAYYFEGWYHDAPGLTAAFANHELRTQFPEREPIWGGGLWRGDTVEIMEQQIDLAADHGISFFSFNLYWYGSAFATLNDGINSGLVNFMQASNRDRMDFNINIIDVHPTPINSDAEWEQVADMLLPYLTDSQYLRVGGKPLITNFNAAGMTQKNYNYFQQIAATAGLGGIDFAANAAGSSSLYSHVTRYNAVPGWGAGEVEYPYQSLTEYVEGNDTWAPGIWNTENTISQSYIPMIMGGWDARPWNTPPTWYFNPSRTPAAVAAHLQKAIDWIDANPSRATPERLVMLYAWNEFGEGGYIAPTIGDPDGAYLDAIRSVVMSPTTGGSCDAPSCVPLGSFETDGFNLHANAPHGSLLHNVAEVISPFFSDGRRLTDVHLLSGTSVQASLQPDNSYQTDDSLSISISPHSSGNVTVSYDGSRTANLTGSGRNALEVVLEQAPSAGKLYVFAEQGQAWNYATRPISGPGSYVFALSDLDELPFNVDFTRLHRVGFGIQAQAAGATLTYEVSDFRATTVGALRLAQLPEPSTFILSIIPGVLLGAIRSRRRA